MLKDEDELEFAVVVGLLTSSDARSIRATADNATISTEALPAEPPELSFNIG